MLLLSGRGIRMISLGLVGWADLWCFLFRLVATYASFCGGCTDVSATIEMSMVGARRVRVVFVAMDFAGGVVKVWKRRMEVIWVKYIATVNVTVGFVFQRSGILSEE